MSSQKSLAVASWGDPRDPATWSGTPSNLIAALEKQGIEIIALPCQLTTSRWRLEHNLDRLQGHSYGYSLRRVGRRNCVRLAQNLPSHCAGILHMGSFTVPFAGSTPNMRNFLVCDAMSNFWHRYSVPGSQGTARQQKEIEIKEQSVVDGSDLYFPISEHVAHSLTHHYGAKAEKITVVGTGRGKIAPLEGTKDYTHKNILAVAAQRLEDKGVPLLIQALQIARKTDSQLHLTLVSPEKYRSVAQDAQGKPLEGITVTGRVEWSELQKFFDEACLFALPALCEPWGLVYAEALATKTPVLGLKRAALPELTNNGTYGFLVEDATPEAIAAALLEAVSDSARLQRMGEEGQIYCLEAFSWDRTAQLISQAIFE